MSTGLDVFDTTVQKTNGWLKDIMEELEWEDRHRAYEALRVMLHALRDRLTVEEAVQLGAQLPLLLRGVYYEGWTPHHKPHKIRHIDEFLAPLQAYFRHDPRVRVERVARAIFRVLAQAISVGELQDIQRIMPEELNTLWPENVR